MANVTIDALPQVDVVANPLTGNEMLVVSQTLVTRRISLQQIKDFVLGAAGIYNITTGVTPPATAFDSNTMFRYAQAGLGNVVINLPNAATFANRRFSFVMGVQPNAGDSMTINAAAGEFIDNGLTNLVISTFGLTDLISDGVQWYSK